MTPIATVPIGLRVDDRLVVVIGAGPIAARKAAAYYANGALLRIVAPGHSAAMDGLGPDDVRIERRVERYRPDHLDGAWFVIAATGDPSVDGAVFADAERRRLWCNAADDPAHCSAILPAVVRRGPITVAISTGGTSPATATWLRRRTEAFVRDDLLSDATEEAHARAARTRERMRSAGQPTEVDGWQQAFDQLDERLGALATAEGTAPR